VLALAFSAIALAGAAVAAASGLLDFRDSRPHEATFPNEITCSQRTTLCTPGRSARGHAFKLFKIGASAKKVQLVGAGVDTGDGRQATPLICTRSGSDLQCGRQPAGGEKRSGLYLPG
jgi:hypothetical protein